MTSTMTLACREFTVVRRLRDLGAEAQQAVVPRQQFRQDLRDRLLTATQQNDRSSLRRVSGPDCLRG